MKSKALVALSGCFALALLPSCGYTLDTIMSVSDGLLADGKISAEGHAAISEVVKVVREGGATWDTVKSVAGVVGEVLASAVLAFLGVNKFRGWTPTQKTQEFRSLKGNS